MGSTNMEPQRQEVGARHPGPPPVPTPMLLDYRCTLFKRFCSQRISAISALDVSRRCALQIYILLYLLTLNCIFEHVYCTLFISFHFVCNVDTVGVHFSIYILLYAHMQSSSYNISIMEHGKRVRRRLVAYGLDLSLVILHEIWHI